MSEAKIAAITGATGFIGGHLTALLIDRGWKIRALVRDPVKARHLQERGVELAVGDMTKPETLPAFFSGASVAFHCGAAIHAAGRDETDYARVNTEGTRAIAEVAARANLEKFVALSSVAAIGIRPGGMIDESFPCQPDLAYGVSKLQAEEAMMRAHRDLGLPLIILRPPTVYGPGERYNFLSLCKAIKHGPFLIIGSGQNRIDFLSVHHLVEAMLLAAESEKSGEIYLVADAQPRPFLDTVNELSRLLKGSPYTNPRLPKMVATLAAVPMEAIARVTGTAMPLNLGRIRTMTSDFCFDLTKIRRDLGYNPADDAVHRMAETIAWYRQENLLPT